MSRKLQELGEFGLIERLKRLVNNKAVPNLIQGIGDDAAVVKIGPKKLALLTTDMLVENVHFQRNLSDFYQLGWKALAASISDVAAMGGRPKYALISLGLPVDISIKSVDKFTHGVQDLAKRFGVILVGGDTVLSPKDIVVNVALVGETEKENLILRAGAKVGDKIFTTGTLGGAAIGLDILKRRLKLKGKSAKKLIRRHILPIPRVQEARLIVKNRLATSMIDISDGLAVSLRFICQESLLGAQIYSENIPVPCLPKINQQTILDYALYGGEDYELLFTVSRDRVKEALKLFPHGMIGDITPKAEGIKIVKKNGTKKNLLFKGYEHFKK